MHIVDWMDSCRASPKACRAVDVQTDNYPSGRQLRDKLWGLRDMNPSNPQYALFNASGFDLRTVDEFAQAFRHSGLDSIDAFVDRHREYEGIAKLAIAYE